MFVNFFEDIMLILLEKNEIQFVETGPGDRITSLIINKYKQM